MTELRIEAFDGDGASWDDFVRKQEGWSHFHLYGWRSVVERTFGHRCIYLVARGSNSELAGVLPLVQVQSRLFGRYLVSMPFVNYGGPVGRDAAIVALVKSAEEVARHEGMDLLELRSRRSLPLSLPVSHRKITVVLDLSAGDPERQWNGLSAKVRSQVRRPQKEGVVVRFGLDQLEPFYRVFSHHMRDLGTPTQSRGFFEAIAEIFPHDVHFGCAYLDGRPIAAGCGFRWASEFEMTWASALTAYKQTSANMLLYWSFIEWAAAAGLSVFNFGRCSPGSGTHRFKLQWGCREEQLWWYSRSLSDTHATPSPDDNTYSWGPRLWKRLPLSLATTLGPHIVRGIP